MHKCIPNLKPHFILTIAENFSNHPYIFFLLYGIKFRSGRPFLPNFPLQVSKLLLTWALKFPGRVMECWWNHFHDANQGLQGWVFQDAVLCLRTNDSQSLPCSNFQLHRGNSHPWGRMLLLWHSAWGLWASPHLSSTSHPGQQRSLVREPVQWA